MTELDPPLLERPLHPGGPSVSGMAWGMWRFAGDDVAAARGRVEAALEAGVTLFDTADIYGPDNGEPFGASEALLGRVFAEAPGLAEHMVLATKGGIVLGAPYDASDAYLGSAIDASLRRLRVERVALWQIHRPDMLTHPAETARALTAAHAAGKIGAVGVSNFRPSQVEALSAYLGLPLVSTQPEFSPLAIGAIADGVLDQAVARRMTVLAWSPLAGGRIAQPDDPRTAAIAAALDETANAYGVSRAAAAYSWIMAHPARPIPIAGAQSLSRIAQIPQAFVPRWTRARWYAVLQAAMGEPLP